MSNEREHSQFTSFLDRLWEQQRQRNLLAPGRTININAMDPLDPIHMRSKAHPEREFDHDADMGREHDDYLRDNGQGTRGSARGSTFRPLHEIAAPVIAGLPGVASPSIVPEMPAVAKTEGEKAED